MVSRVKAATAGRTDEPVAYKYDIANAQKISVATASAATSSAFGASGAEVVLEIVTSTACWITWAASPTAVVGAAGNIYMAANETRKIVIDGGLKLAAIRVSTDGNLVATPLVLDT